jgi:cation diffusion facilitator family transporter
MDSLVSGLQALLVAGTAVYLAYTIVQGRYRPLSQEGFSWVFLYEGIAMGLNGALAYLLWRGAVRHQSQILRAESWHLMADVTTSILVLAGIGAVWMGLSPLVDKGVGLAMVAFIGYGAFQLLRETGATLLDAQDPQLLGRLAEAIEKHRQPAWIDIHNVRIQRYGASLHVDGHVTFPWYWSLREAHAALKDLETLLQQELRQPVEFFWHMDPCEPVCCPYCEIGDCPMRQAPFVRRIPLRPESLFVNQKGIK